MNAKTFAMIRIAAIALTAFLAQSSQRVVLAQARDDGASENAAEALESGADEQDFELGATGEIDRDLRIIEDPNAEDAGSPRSSSTGANSGAAGFFNFFNDLNQLNQQRGLDARDQVRIPIRLGFAYSGPPATVVSNRLASRLLELPRLRGAGSIAIEMDGRTAVLKGSVSSEDERRLAAQVALFEPGVSSVRNELAVQTTSSEELPLPSAN